MNLPTLATLTSIAVAIAGCANPATFAGTLAGEAIGTAIADRTPPAAAVVVEPEGGNFCPVMNAFGGPPPLTADDRLSRPMSEWTVGIAEHGEAFCQWGPPQ